MGYVPGFTNDIFISYSHKDDQAVVDGGPGWVAEFHRALVIEVEEALGEDVKVWRDKRITGATDFTKELEKQVRGSAMLLAILSPSYVNSKWCDWELTGFAGSRRIGDLWVDTKCRAIKVVKRPADVSRLRVLAETEGVKFFDVDPAKEVAYERGWSSDLYKERLTELGQEIAFILSAMRKARSVFLGMASPSLREQRERVRQELIGRDYRVLTAPDGPPDDRRVSVRAAVNESALSVLFYDRTAPLEQSAEALASLEREVALSQRAKQIIVVHGPYTASQAWDEPGATGGGSGKVEWLIEQPIHKLYHTVLQMLGAQVEPDATLDDKSAPDQKTAGPAPPPASDPARAPDLSAELPPAPIRTADPKKLVRIYLVCDRDDNPLGLREPNRALRLRDHLMKLGFEVKFPLAPDDAQYSDAHYSRDNRNKLKQCDAVLLYWGTADQEWFENRIKELEQARGWRRGKAFTALGGYVADPGGPRKEHFATLELDELIKQIETFDLADAKLVSFVKRLVPAS